VISEKNNSYGYKSRLQNTIKSYFSIIFLYSYDGEQEVWGVEQVPSETYNLTASSYNVCIFLSQAPYTYFAHNKHLLN
jgi:hypothetical protein